MKTQYRKCCEKYGEKITEMLNNGFFECNDTKDNKKFLKNLSVFIFDVCGNVNASQRLDIIAGKMKTIKK